MCRKQIGLKLEDPAVPASRLLERPGAFHELGCVQEQRRLGLGLRPTLGCDGQGLGGPSRIPARQSRRGQKQPRYEVIAAELDCVRGRLLGTSGVVKLRELNECEQVEGRRSLGCAELERGLPLQGVRDGVPVALLHGEASKRAQNDDVPRIGRKRLAIVVSGGRVVSELLA